MPTGVLTEDADKSGPSMTLTDVTGEWKPGLTAVNETEVTEHAPCSGDIQFLSSKPETVTGTVTAWGAANWKLTNTDTNDVQTATVQLQNTDPEQGPTTFTVEDNTQYSVEVSYSSSDPASGPVSSDPTTSKPATAEVVERTATSARRFIQVQGNADLTINETGVDNTNKSLIWAKARVTSEAIPTHFHRHNCWMALIMLCK